MTTYRTKTYIAADFDRDRDAVEQLRKWNDDNRLGLSFHDVHELYSSRDSSLYCSIKRSLQTRMSISKEFVLIVGKQTKSVTKGSCRYCQSYNSYTRTCARGYAVDSRSYIEYECDEAIKAGIKIIVLYKDSRIDKSLCPEIIKDKGIHSRMIKFQDGKFLWDYGSVKRIFDANNNQI